MLTTRPTTTTTTISVSAVPIVPAAQIVPSVWCGPTLAQNPNMRASEANGVGDREEVGLLKPRVRSALIASQRSLHS